MEIEQLEQEILSLNSIIEEQGTELISLRKKIGLTDMNSAPFSVAAVTNIRNLIERYAPTSSRSSYSMQLWGKEQEVFVYEGRGYIIIDEKDNGKDLTDVVAYVVTAGSGAGTTQIQVHNLTDGVDMLSTVCSIDSGKNSSEDATTPAVVNSANSEVATNDILRFDIDAVTATAPEGLIVKIGLE
jgi:hypothetical protein